MLARSLQMAVIALIAGFIMHFAVTQMIFSDLENSLIRYAEQGATTIETYLTGRLNEVRSIAANSVVGNTRLPMEKRMSELEKMLNLDKFRRLSIADTKGNSVTTDGIRLFVGDRGYFIKAMNGEASISDPIVSRADNTMVIVVAAPIIEDGRVSGVVYVTYDAGILCDMTDRIRLNDDGYSFILNKDGVIISHEDRQLVYNMANDLAEKADDPKAKRLIELERKMIAGQSGTGDYYHNGEEWYMGFCPIGGTGWSLAVTAPKRTVFSRLNAVFIILFIFIIASSLIIAIVLSRSGLLKTNLIRQQINSLRVADITHLIVLNTDRDGKIISSNRYADDILMHFDRLGAEKVRNIFELLTEEDSGKFRNAIEKFRHDNSSTMLELTLKRGSGRPVIIYCNVITDRENGDLVEILGIDITERVEQEKKLRDSFEELKAVYGELAATEETIRQLAFRDSLTGLPNRNALYDLVKKALVEKGKDGKIALFNLDLDNFKYVNDTFGRAAGDQLLAEVGRRLKESFPENAVVARFEGDEFAVFFYSMRTAAELDEKIAAINSVFGTPFIILGNRIHITASCGISLFPDHAGNMDDLFKSSDVAMYRAKKDGKNKHVVFRREMDNEFTERVNMENDLRRAIEENEFVLYYQPQVDLATGKTSGFEALIRWMHPERGMVLPLRFIDIAEETGLIVQIGKWVLKTACGFIKRLNDRTGGNFKISVNISVIQLMQEDFVGMVTDVLRQTGLEPGLLELELTESKLIESIEFNLQKLHELRGKGVKISMDDFGKGFSSLSYLKQLPINTLKIDKSFVDDIPENDTSMIESIIHIGHKRKLTVVAEGVEKREQMEYLARCRCDMIQGYYYSRPVPENEVERLI